MVEVNKEKVCTFYCAYFGVRFQNIDFAVHFFYKNILRISHIYKSYSNKQHPDGEST